MKRVHEGLNNYIKSLKTAGDVDAPGLQPRLPLGPDGAIPVGLKPLPSSSQAPKKTNATIVYARTAMNSTRGDVMGEVRVADVGGVAIPIEEGSIVFTLRCAPATTMPLGQNVKTFSLSRVNHILEQEQGLEESKRTHDKWSPDGVCNNLDGEDPYNEFKDFAIANVATQGFVRFSTLGMDARIANADRIFVGLWQVGDRWFFERFTSHQITTSSTLTTITINKKPFKWENLIKAWQVGRVVDGKQSKNMLTINVSIDPVAETPPEEEPPSMLVPDKDDPRKMIQQRVKVYYVDEQLKRMWLTSKNAEELARIEAGAADRLAKKYQASP